MTVQYMSSKGPMDIVSMPTPYMRNALAKLQREGDPSRAAEIEAMSAQLAERAAQEDEAPPPAGHNNPPEETAAVVVSGAGPDTWGAIKAHLDDLLTEARNWADGAEIANQGQADAVARLTDQLRQGMGAADDARVLEKKPHDEAIEEIQGRYNPYIAPLTNKKPGSVPRVMDALKVAQTKWLRKLEAEREAESKRLREIANAELKAAAEKLREAAQSSDIEQREAAEAIFEDAKALDTEATRAASAKAQAVGDGRATGLRDNWVTTIADPVQALRWAWQTHPEPMKALALDLAKAEVRAGKRTIPGFNIVNERKV